MVTVQEYDILPLFKCPLELKLAREGRETWLPHNYPEVQIYNNFLTGLFRTRGRSEGQYPYGYFDFINYLFGRQWLTLEVCSRHVKVDRLDTAATVDLNPSFQPTFCTDAETLTGVPSNFYRRVRLDPPYGPEQSKEMYGITRTPDFSAMLKAAARVCTKDGLIFMLRGQVGGNQQYCKDFGLVRIGLVCVTVVPNVEARFLNVYAKIDHPALLEESNVAGQSILF